MAPQELALSGERSAQGPDVWPVLSMITFRDKKLYIQRYI